MILNVPTYEGLNEVALRLYFAAWESVIYIKPAFDSQFDPTPNALLGPDPWKEEWEQYLGTCQPELQSACATLQQSNELALKARICRVSPYILLLGSDWKPRTSTQDIEFSDLRTMDAVDLPATVNLVCRDRLSDRFITIYNDVRSLRNRYTHLGDARHTFVPDDLIDLMVDIYVELWPDRLWLRDRAEFESKSRSGFLHDGKYTSPEMATMQEWSIVTSSLRKSKFHALFGVAKSKRRYLCHSCYDAADTRYSDLEAEDCGTATLSEGGASLVCLMCGETIAVKRQKCLYCKGNVLGVDDGKHPDRCHTCGSYQDDDLN